MKQKETSYSWKLQDIIFVAMLCVVFKGYMARAYPVLLNVVYIDAMERISMPVGSMKTVTIPVHNVLAPSTYFLLNDDVVIGVVAVDDSKRILMVTDKGKGKQVRFDQFNAHGRGTMGQKIYTVEESGLVGAVSVDDDSDVVFITMKGQTIRVHARDISIQGRAAMGVKVASFKKKDDTVNAIAVTGYQEEEEDPESTASEEAQVEESSETKD